MATPTALYPFTPAGSNVVMPTMTKQGRAYMASTEAIKDTTPADTALWQRLKFGKCQPQPEQSFMVDAMQVPTTCGTSIAMGADIGDPITIVTEQTTTPKTQSISNNRGIIKNQLDKRRFSYFITEEAQQWAKEGAVAGGITDEKMREIQRRTKLEWMQVEFDLHSKRAQVADLMDGSTAGAAGGVFSILETVPTNWANLGWTANTNKTADAAGKKVAKTLTTIKDVSEDDMRAGIMFLNKAGSGKDVHLFCPDLYHDFISNTYKGRPEVMVNTQESAHSLDMGFETYKAVSGIRMTIIPNRTMSDLVMDLLDLNQWQKRMGIPFGVYPFTDGKPDIRGWVQFSWTVLGDPRGGFGWYVNDGADSANVPS
jgi:hypothetical protein